MLTSVFGKSSRASHPASQAVGDEDFMGLAGGNFELARCRCWPCAPEMQLPASTRAICGAIEFKASGFRSPEWAVWRLDRGTRPRKPAGAMETKLTAVQIEKPEPINFILGQTHFIKSVEDIHEALVNAVPGIKFGLAFCESSGKCLVRWSGTDPAMIELAKRNALAIGAGHSFILFLGDGFYPVNVLNAVKMVPEVCRIFCATANPVQALVAETNQGRGIMGVVDGVTPEGVEGEADVEWRKKFLRQIGYKL